MITAIELLKESSPKAYAWWEENLPLTMAMPWFVFNKEACQLIEKEYEATHIVRRLPEEDCWVPVAYFTRERGSAEPFYLGRGFDRSFRRQEVETETTQEIVSPLVLVDTQSLWLDSEGILWLADSTDPIGDDNKAKLELGMALEKIEHIKKTMSLHLEIPLERITNETEIPDPDGLAINLRMTKGWHIKTPDRSGDYFALQSKPFTLKELIELNK